MGVYPVTCKCGRNYLMFSFDRQSLYRGQMCEICWSKLEQEEKEKLNEQSKRMEREQLDLKNN